MDLSKVNPGHSRFVLARPDTTGLSEEEKANRLTRYINEVLPGRQAVVELLRKSPEALVVYNGFEPSGRLHIGQGILNAAVTNNFIRNGNFTMVILIADQFAAMNNKCGGDLQKIRTLGRYMVEVWKASGIDMTGVKIVWASDLMCGERASDYWKILTDIQGRTSLKRALRCTPALGRKTDEEDQNYLENIKASHILYTGCQITDSQMLGVDVITMGSDQRKINMGVVEYCNAVGKTPPIVMHYDLIPGLKEGEGKMSKSNPDSAIFMDDSVEEVARKLKKAFCPPGEKVNPCLAYIRQLIVPAWDNLPQCSGNAAKGFVVDGVTFSTYEQLEAAYVAGEVHPKGLKTALTGWVNELLEPVRQHFASNEEARSLLAEVKRLN